MNDELEYKPVVGSKERGVGMSDNNLQTKQRMFDVAESIGLIEDQLCYVNIHVRPPLDIKAISNIISSLVEAEEE